MLFCEKPDSTFSQHALAEVVLEIDGEAITLSSD
jgi:hypothetical protein